MAIRIYGSILCCLCIFFLIRKRRIQARGGVLMHLTLILRFFGSTLSPNDIFTIRRENGRKNLKVGYFHGLANGNLMGRGGGLFFAPRHGFQMRQNKERCNPQMSRILSAQKSCIFVIFPRVKFRPGFLSLENISPS